MHASEVKKSQLSSFLSLVQAIKRQILEILYRYIVRHYMKGIWYHHEFYF